MISSYGSDRETEARDIHDSSLVGEVTITLHDVTVLFGPRMNGPHVTGTDDGDWVVECEGVAPDPTALRGGALK